MKFNYKLCMPHIHNTPQSAFLLTWQDRYKLQSKLAFDSCNFEGSELVSAESPARTCAHMYARTYMRTHTHVRMHKCACSGARECVHVNARAYAVDLCRL